jgi:hypothetical protein
MFDESLLDDPDALTRADTHDLLRGAAAAGARVRTAARLADEAGVGALKPDGRPRTILIAGPGPLPARLADLLGALAAAPVQPVPAGGAVPSAAERRWNLPGWAGSADLLLLTTDDGTEPGLVRLVEQAYRRGCAPVAIVPEGRPLTEAVTQARGFVLPHAPTPGGAGDTGDHRDPGVFWGVLTSLLTLTDRLGLLSATPHAIQGLADRLDAAAERYGPTAETYRNPAKTLTAELADALPLLWSEGPLGGPVARRFADLLTARAGRPALAAALPEAVADHAALLDGAHHADPDDLSDFFRDRVDEPAAARPRIVLLGEPGQADAAPTGAADTARRTAADHAAAFSALDAPPGGPLESLAELLALTDFTTAYLALATAGPRTA